MLFDLDLDLVFERETSRKRPKTERGRSAVAVADTGSVSLTSALTVCKADGAMGREGSFAVAGSVAFSVVVLVLVGADAGCEAALLGRFLLEEVSTATAKAGAMTRGEETEEEEP